MSPFVPLRINRPVSVYIFVIVIMNPIVLLSDNSREFPNNTTRAFKMRLPSTIQFDGDWEVGLVSISMPDRGLDLNELFTKDTNNVVRIRYNAKDTKTNVFTREMENVNSRPK